jgi:hypothetical protein
MPGANTVPYRKAKVLINPLKSKWLPTVPEGGVTISIANNARVVIITAIATDDAIDKNLSNLVVNTLSRNMLVCGVLHWLSLSQTVVFVTCSLNRARAAIFSASEARAKTKGR